MKTTPETTTYRPYTLAQFDEIPQIQGLSSEQQLSMKAVASVLPFRTNRYVVEDLIDWKSIPEDPIYQLTFPQPGMLDKKDLDRMRKLLRKGAAAQEIRDESNRIRMKLNPHPAGQMEHNVPKLDGTPLPGMQHKYQEVVLFFPSQGQTCHAYCTYCFRWAQFVGIEELKFASRELQTFLEYLRRHKEVTDVLFTGGDPMIMRSNHLREYIEPLLGPGFEHIQNIRIGTKSPAYWPQRFVSDRDSDDVLRLFEEVGQAGKHMAIMAHFSHPRELEPEIAKEGIRRIRGTGAVVRTQAPLIRHVNDDADVWAAMWKEQVRLGCIPYYMFVERDTGPKNYFEIPLARAYEIFRKAYHQVSGLCRTVRGPSMSATPGKIHVMGIAEIKGEKVFILQVGRGRNREWVRRPFFAKFDPKATWLDDLKPAFGEKKFFFEEEVQPEGVGWE